MFQRNPEKLEAKALDYERRGKTAKAAKYREKAARLRGGNVPVTTTGNTIGTTQGTTTTYFTSFRAPQTYEQNALKWEQRGNWQKAQKNREKVWRLQNPQYPATYAAPMFYDNNHRFLGYNVQGGQQYNQGFGQQQGFNQGIGQQQGFNQGMGQQQGFNQGIGQQGFNQQYSLNKGGATIHNVLPATVETHMHPTIIQQTTRPEKIVEVQPIVHREIDQPSVHIVEKHTYEQVRSTGPGVITDQAIVLETIHPRVIEEIQPVVHREVPAPFVERVEQHVTEHVVQPTTMTKDVINEGQRTGPAIAAGGPGFQSGQGYGQGLNQNQQYGQALDQNSYGAQQQGFNQGQGLSSGQQGFNQGQGLSSGQQGFNQGQSGQQGFNQGQGLSSGQQGFNQGQNLSGQQGLNSGLNSGVGSQSSTTSTNTGLNRRL